MFFIAGRNGVVVLGGEGPAPAVTTPFEDWCSKERRDPDDPDSWCDFELSAILPGGGGDADAA